MGTHFDPFAILGSRPVRRVVKSLFNTKSTWAKFFQKGFTFGFETAEKNAPPWAKKGRKAPQKKFSAQCVPKKSSRESCQTKWNQWNLWRRWNKNLTPDPKNGAKIKLHFCCGSSDWKTGIFALFGGKTPVNEAGDDFHQRLNSSEDFSARLKQLCLRFEQFRTVLELFVENARIKFGRFSCRPKYQGCN